MARAERTPREGPGRNGPLAAVAEDPAAETLARLADGVAVGLVAGELLRLASVLAGDLPAELGGEKVMALCVLIVGFGRRGWKLVDGAIVVGHVDLLGFPPYRFPLSLGRMPATRLL